MKWHKNWVMFSLGIHTAVEIIPFASQTFNERSMGLEHELRMVGIFVSNIRCTVKGSW